MHRLLSCLLVILLASSCTRDRLDTMQHDLTYAAQEQLKKTLAAHFTRELGKGVGVVIDGLARPGGYLDNPLVRILLPPPLGLALDVGRDMSANPQAKLLQALMNRAAEQAIPGAAPVLKAALTQITPTEARRLLEGDKTAATEFLRAKTGAALREALRPSITASLAVGGAQRVHDELLTSQPALQPDTRDAAPPVEPVHDLEGYVTDQAVDGAFKALGAQETQIRERLDAATGGVLQGLEKTPAP